MTSRSEPVPTAPRNRDCVHGQMRRKCDLCDALADVAALGRVLTRMFEYHLGCPVIATTKSEQEKWARAHTVTEEEFDAVYEALHG